MACKHASVVLAATVLMLLLSVQSRAAWAQALSGDAGAVALQGPHADIPVQKLSPVLVGVIFGVLTHELGHAIIGELQLPAVGPEEDAADEFSAMVYVHNIRRNSRFRDLSLASARLWHEFGLERKDNPLAQGWFDEHAPDAVRYGKMLCILAGGVPDGFDDEIRTTVPADYHARFKSRCRYEFEKKWRAWNMLLRPHRRNLDPNLPGDQAANAAGGKIAVNYRWLDVPLATGLTKTIGPAIKTSQILDNFATAFRANTSCHGI
jgi:hypothetical protein